MSRKKLQYERRTTGTPQVRAFRLAGVLSEGHEAYALLEDLRSALVEGASLVVLDLAGVDHISSAGAGIIAACLTSARAGGARLCLTGTPSRGRQLLEIVGLWQRVETELPESTTPGNGSPAVEASPDLMLAMA